MGDIAEMMLDGLLCESCGVVIDGLAPGYSRECGVCCPPMAKQKKDPGPKCGKRVSPLGLENHMKDAHKVPIK